MTYTPVPSKTTGEIVTATDWNTYLVANQAAGVPDIFEADGDLAVASGADVAGRLAKGSEYQVLTVKNSAVTWGSSAVNYHQGIGWTDPPGTLLTISRVLTVSGVTTASVASSASGTYATTFLGGLTFNSGPLVMLTSATDKVLLTFNASTTTNFTVNYRTIDGTSLTSFKFFWVAYGTPA